MGVNAAAPRTQFEFICVSGSNIRGDASTRKRVRSRAQADYRRRQNPAPKPALHQDFDVAEWLQVVSQESAVVRKSSSKAMTESQRKIPARQRSSVSQVPFANNRSNPFALMDPTQLKRVQPLWAHLHKGTCVVFKSMVEIGFLDMLRGSAALTQMLSSSAWHMENEAGEIGSAKGNTDYATFSVMATASLRRMLQQPSQRTSVETIIAILTFAAYANLISDINLLNVHLDGLSHILACIGGFGALQELPILRLMTYWIDVRASHLQDIPPRFPQPWDILLERSQLNMSPTPTAMPETAKASTEMMMADPDMAKICSYLQQVNCLIDSGFTTHGGAFWQRVLFAQFNLLPLMHSLLSMTRYDSDASHDSNDSIKLKRKEYLRIAAILYVRQLWTKFGMDSSGTSLYTDKLAAGITSLDLVTTWDKDDTFRYWILLVGATCSSVPVDMRLKYGMLLTAQMASVELPSRLTSSLWCDSALGSLRSTLEQIKLSVT